MNDLSEFYDFVYESIKKCRSIDQNKIADELKGSLSVSQSGLEIVGYCNSLLKEHAKVLAPLVGNSRLVEVDTFKRRCYGEE